MASLPPINITKLIQKANSSPPAHHVGNPPTSFVNPWPSFHQHSPLEFLTASLHRPEFKPVPSRDKLVTIQKPDWNADKGGLKATWIGHATFLVETPKSEDANRGVGVLFDPVFAERTSPVSWAGPKRYTPAPCTLDELPDIDVVIISHDHYDHMDSDTMLKLYTKRKGKIHFLVALGNASRLRGFGIDGASVTELDWWEGARIDVAGAGSVTMTCTPSQHFSGRGVFDHGSTLWCSWVLETERTHQHSSDDKSNDSRKLFFAGDTGYRDVPKDANETEMPFCPAFREIGGKFGPFDLCLLPIGLYSPRHLLSPIHCTPEDALCLHKDLRSQKSIGMHYGTVRGGLSQYFEDVTEPPRRFKEACEKEGKVWREELCLIGVGETIAV
ncbi:hypothetical protein MMC28_002121 [Mycoblastus sanguinarius]|nr:hypothetical protein [Mycoblastus sanguinarius]